MCLLISEDTSNAIRDQKDRLLNQDTSAKLAQVPQLLSVCDRESESKAQNELSFATEDLIAYLNNHIYTSPSLGSFTGGFGHNFEESTKGDLVQAVKTEIRSVKGAVLNMYCNLICNINITNMGSSRNFPAPAVTFR